MPIIWTDGVSGECLRWTTEHPMSSYGLGVLLDAHGHVVDGVRFRTSRDQAGRVLVTEDVARVAHALGVPSDEPGLIQTSAPAARAYDTILRTVQACLTDPENRRPIEID